MAFKRTNKQSISDQVFVSLRKDILDGVYAPGDRLPSESKLSADMGVSKSTLKVAVQRLVALGLVETRRGEGNFVREFDPSQYLGQMNEFLVSDQDLSSLTEYRLYVEMATTRLAIHRARPENFKRMEEILREMEDASEKNDLIRHGQLDFEFHLEICRATGNNMFVLAYTVIGKMVRQHATMLNEGVFQKIREQGRDKDIHWLLYHAIKRKDIDACREGFVEMFSVFENLPERITKYS